jgi:hypothetical protein
LPGFCLVGLHEKIDDGNTIADGVGGGGAGLEVFDVADEPVADSAFPEIGVTFSYRLFSYVVVELNQLVEHFGDLLLALEVVVSLQFFPITRGRPIVNRVEVDAGSCAYFLLGKPIAGV